MVAPDDLENSVEDELPEGLDDESSEEETSSLDPDDDELSEPEPEDEPELEDDSEPEPDEEPEPPKKKRKRGRPRKKKSEKGKRKVTRTTTEEFDEPLEHSDEMTSIIQAVRAYGGAGSISVDRMKPTYINGIPSKGILERYDLDVTFEELQAEIKEKYGGGTYAIRVLDDRGVPKGRKQFYIPGIPKMPDEQLAKTEGAKSPDDEVKQMQIDIKKLELEEKKAEQRRQLEKRLQRFQEEDEARAQLSMPDLSEGGDSNHEIELLRQEMRHREELNTLRNEIREMGRSDKGAELMPIVESIRASSETNMKSMELMMRTMMQSGTDGAAARQETMALMMQMMMKMNESQQLNQKAIAEATSSAAATQVELLKGMLTEKHADRRADAEQMMGLITMGAEFAGVGGGNKTEAEFDTGSKVADTILGGIAALSQRIQGASAPQAAPAPQPLPAAPPAPVSAPAPPVATPPRPSAIPVATPTRPPTPSAVSIPPQPAAVAQGSEVDEAAAQRAKVMLALLRALAQEATQAPLESQWATEAVKYLPADVRGQFMDCGTMQDVINVVVPFMDGPLQNQYMALIQDPGKRQWIMSAVNALKVNIEAATSQQPPKGAVSVGEIGENEAAVNDSDVYDQEEDKAEEVTVEQPESF